MASETLSFEIIGNSASASKAFKDTAAGATAASAAAKELSDRLAAQSKTAQVSAQATLSMAKADELLALESGETARALKEQGDAAADAAAKTQLAAKAAKDAAAANKQAADALGGNIKGTAIAAALVEGISTAPALLAGGAVIGGVLAGGLAAYASSPQLQAAGKSLLSGLEKEVEGAAQPLVAPVGEAISQLGSYARGLGPELKSAFADVAPDVQPLEDGLEGLVSGVLPGLLALMRDGQPAAKAFGAVLSGIGTGTGNLLTSLSGDLGPASQELSNVGTVLESVLSAAGPLLSAAAVDAKPLADGIAAIASGAGRLISATPVPVLEGITGAVGGIVIATKAWGVAEGAIAALSGSAFLTEAGAAVTAYAAAVDGASASEAVMLAGEVALEAVSPVGWAVAGTAAIAALGVVLLHGADATSAYIAQQQAADQATGYNVDGYAKLSAQLGETAKDTEAVSQLAGGNGVAFRLAGQAAPQYQQALGQLSTAQQAAGTAAANLGTNLGILESRYGINQVAAEQLATAAGVTARQLQSGGTAAQGLIGKIETYASKTSAALQPTSQLAGDISTLDNNMLSATDQLGAFNNAWDELVGNSVSDQSAILADAQSFVSLQTAISQNGAGSLTAQQAFVSYIQQVGTSLTTLEKNKASVGAINSAYTTSIKNLTSLHKLTPQQRQDVQGLTTDYNLWAATTVGLGQDTLTAAKAIAGDFTGSLNAVAQKSPAVHQDISNLADAVLKTGTQSSATAGDRAQLIKDLESAGVQAQVAGTLVGGLIGTLGNVPRSTVANVVVHASGSGGVTETSTLPGMSQTTAHMVLGGLSAGGRLPGYGGGDRRLYMLEDGEAVVDKGRARKYAPLLGAMGVPGMSAGGLVTAAGSGEASFAAGWENAFARAAVSALASSALAIGSAGVSNASAYAALVSAAAKEGWTGAQWAALNNVEMREAGYSLTAQNPTSGAFGMAQFINGAQEYFQYGGNPSTAAGQATAMVNYVAQRYGTPANAWAHEVNFGWYDHGGALKPGLTLAYNGTGRPEQVIGPGGSAGGSGPVTVVVENHGVIGSQAEVRQWLNEEIDALARQGKLTYALRRSPSAR